MVHTLSEFEQWLRRLAFADAPEMGTNADYVAEQIAGQFQDEEAEQWHKS